MIDWRVPNLMEFGPTEDCGCPMERWLYKGFELHMHFEPTKVDVFIDAGDWDREIDVATREDAFAWIDALPTEEEWAATQEGSSK